MTPLEHARAVADAVLYEGYLLYPYRASAQKNQSRWQFGVLGPPGAADAGVGEEPDLWFECVVAPRTAPADVQIRLRFLHRQRRSVERADSGGGFEPVPTLLIDGQEYLSWDEAVDCELAFGPVRVDGAGEQAFDVARPAARAIEPLVDQHAQVRGRLVRSRSPLRGTLRARAEPAGEFVRLRVSVANTGAPAADAGDAQATSFLSAHVLLTAAGAEFISAVDPPAAAQPLVDQCGQHRCWPALAGPAGDASVLLGSPIIVEDHPQIAEQSAGALFDSTEIDEILTLRVMTMTDAEKAEARATDPRAADIIDRCDGLSPEQMGQMHGVLLGPARKTPGGDAPWWDPEADASVDPDSDAVSVNGVAVAKGSVVRLHPGRRADAQDLFFDDQIARVTSVRRDVDGRTHVAVVLADDPAADLHDWYGRHLYFAPDEIEPLAAADTPPLATGEERS